MKKIKTYEISVIDKTYSKIISDETKFYTSDTALELAFELKETEYNFESAEIVLLNVDDRSLATRPVSKMNDGFVYKIDDDITTHYGDWRGQLMLVENGEVHVSSPIKFRIENDLYCNKPLEIIEVVSWVSLKRYADSLIDELKQAVLDVEGMDDTFKANELERQATFETNEIERDETFNTNEDIRQTQELEREEAESQRQTVFEENESVRTETFNANETTRQKNEDARIEAEKQREGTVSKIENRQTSVESQFDAVQQEMTGKDVISAPEIIASRNGEANLKTRLDKEQQEVTTQLAQKLNKGNVSVSDINKNLGKLDQSFMSDEFLQQMAGNTAIGAVTAPMSQTTQKLADKSVSSTKTKFIKNSSNLFNKNDVVLGKIVGADGLITDNSNYGYSHLIEVAPSETIYTVGVYHIAFYDVDMQFKQRITKTTELAGSATVVPIDCYYGIITFNPTSTYWKNNGIQVNKSNTKLPYEPFYEELESIGVDGGNINWGSISNETLKNHAINPNKLSFIQTSTNLFDKSKEKKNTTLESGVETFSQNQNLSDYIEVEPNSVISTRAFNYIFHFNKEKKYIDRQTKVNVFGGGSWTIPSDAYYIRGRYPNNIAQLNEAQINMGNELLPYEPYYNEVNDVTFSKEIKNDYLNEVNDPSKRIIFDMDINGVYRTETNMLTKWSYGGATKSAEVYAKYDELMAQHPDYISKQFLGNDDFGNPISLYKFSQSRPVSTGKKHIPTIYLTAGVHGAEIISPFGTWLMFDEICNNWQSDPLLEALRFNVEFLVIPVANPSGFEDLTRWNRNRVDINRNFDTPDWFLGDPTSGSYGGSAPMSEKETNIIASVYDMYPDIDIMYDFHNFGTNPDNYMLWVRTEGGPRSWYIGENLITLMTREWRKTYDFIPSDYTKYIGWVNAGGEATVPHYAKTRGVPLVGTLEVSNQILLDPNSNGIDENLMKTTVEAYINWIIINLKELSSNARLSL